MSIEEEPAAGCCGGASGGCAVAALRRTPCTATVTRSAVQPSATWLLADSVWWGGRLRNGVALRVDGGGRAKPMPAEMAPADSRSLPGTLLPGLIDAHVHSALVDLAAVRAGGIAAVWDLGADPAVVADLAAKARGLPLIRYAGPFLIAPGGYPSDRSWAPAGSWREIHSAADGADAVTEASGHGASLIKVTAHAGGPMLPQGTLDAVVTAAHAARLPVVVHAEGPGTVAAALAAGADMLAHTPWSEPLDDGLLRESAERMRWISTLDIHGRGQTNPAVETALRNLRLFLGYGGSVRYGTDLGNGPLPVGVNAREIRLLQSAGLTPDDILTAMTESDSPALSLVPGGLDREPTAFADSLATAQVIPRD
ncbi:amidohydrolase family protein [Actinoplanes sp. NBRC 101535]|uniref:amidohydrolase family protein n=1 Tax=Actinoplanes sp. NBRC 101535 TaxID=3032196 RepID=UPI0024A0A174|nr:amidohydrolase family protein [Actinoplanes sp. NBRC 101535]GLY05649.1 amidohydrolase [Actinoplanes sp. NBRC 101535]